jgi:cell division protease FtsH
MVCRFGMSDLLGPQTFGAPAGGRFLQSPALFGDPRNFSEDTAREIDREVKAIVDAEHSRAHKILEDRRELLTQIAERLLIEETLDRAELEQMVGSARKTAVAAASPARNFGPSRLS